MIEYQRHVLDNGLKVLIHEDQSTPLVALNLLYNVGSRDEDEDKTGFAHLFEHLMFNGSKNIPDFDAPIQLAGGENNAFTNNDITNFYDIVPADNFEIALWLESDRMRDLSFDQKGFDTQKKVVVEEFKETCLNIPYGDAWHKLSSMAYHTHPYKWPTIGKVPEHISDSHIDDARAFFSRHYCPDNAILVIAGQVQADHALEMIEKWFGDIPCAGHQKKILNQEPLQLEKHCETVTAAIPAEAIFLGFHTEGRQHDDYYTCDIISDILSNGRSSRFYQRLYKKSNQFSRVEAYISGTADPGLFIIEGKLPKQRNVQEGLAAIWAELEDLKLHGVNDRELDKVKHKIESSLYFSEVSVLNKAISLAFFEWLGDASMINHQADKYDSVTSDDVQKVAQKIFTQENCNELIYLKEESD